MKLTKFADLGFTAAGHEDPANPGVWKKVLLHRGDLSPGVIQMVNWAKLPAGRHFAAHYHESMQELFVMMHGTAEIEVGGHRAVLVPGDAVVIDPREVHEMWNHGAEDAEYLAVGVVVAEGGKSVVVDKQVRP